MREEEINRLNVPNMLVKPFYTRKSSRGGGVLILANLKFKVKQLPLPDIVDLTSDYYIETGI